MSYQLFKCVYVPLGIMHFHRESDLCIHFWGTPYIYIPYGVILFHRESHLLLCVFGRVPDTFCFLLFTKVLFLDVPTWWFGFYKDLFPFELKYWERNGNVNMVDFRSALGCVLNSHWLWDTRTGFYLQTAISMGFIYTIKKPFTSKKQEFRTKLSSTEIFIITNLKQNEYKSKISFE